jgi:Fe-S-cluster-containing hydrogenase component 2
MKTLMVTNPQKCSECEICINACEKAYGIARGKKTDTIPIFCMHCHPDKAPCYKICPVNAIERIGGETGDVLQINNEKCIFCNLCAIACPIGIISIDKKNMVAQKCTLCMESDHIIPICIEACKDNVLNVFSIEDLQKLNNDEILNEELQENVKNFIAFFEKYLNDDVDEVNE